MLACVLEVQESKIIMTIAAANKGDTGFAGMANAIRALAMDAVEAAKSGHPGMPMGMADVATVLFNDVMRYDAADPGDSEFDLSVLSKNRREVKKSLEKKSRTAAAAHGSRT